MLSCDNKMLSLDHQSDNQSDNQITSKFLYQTAGGTLVVKDAGGENRKRRSKIFP